MDVFGEELLLETGSEEASHRQEYEGSGKHAPAVRDGAPHQPVVEAVEAALALLFDRGLALLRRPLDVVTEEGDERHGHHERAEQRRGHHDGKAPQELARIAGQHQERQVGDDVGDGGEEDGRRQLRGAEPGRDSPRKARGQTSLDPVPGDDGHVDQEPERDDERRHRHLLEVDAQHVDDTEGHGQGDGYGQGHDEGESPLPEPDERDDHDEDDGFVERPQEQVGVLLDLQGLVGSVDGDEIGREDAVELRQLCVDRLTEGGDLLLIAHVDGDRDGSTAAPAPPAVLPGVVVQVARGALVSTADVDEVAEVDGSAGGRRGHHDVPDHLGVLELPGGRQGDLPVSGLEHPARRDDVARLDQPAQVRGLEPVGGEPILGEFQIDDLGQDASALHFRRLGSALHGTRDEVGEVVQLGVGVLVARNLGQPRAGVRRIVDDDRAPGVGMELRALQLVREEVRDERLDRRVVLPGRGVEANEASSSYLRGAVQHSRFHRPPCEDYGRTRDHRRRHGVREGVDDADRPCRRWGRPARTRRRDRGLNRLRPQVDLDRVCLGARHGQHQRRRISEVALEGDGARSLGKLAAQSIELQVDVAELALQIVHVFGKLDEDVGMAGQ